MSSEVQPLTALRASSRNWRTVRSRLWRWRGEFRQSRRQPWSRPARPHLAQNAEEARGCFGGHDGQEPCLAKFLRRSRSDEKRLPPSARKRRQVEALPCGRDA
jgi:hypothetical protein